MTLYTWLWCSNCERIGRTVTSARFWCGPRNGQRPCRAEDQTPFHDQDAANAAEHLGGWDAVQVLVATQRKPR